MTTQPIARGSGIGDLIRTARGEGRSLLLGAEIDLVCAAYGIPIPRSRVATSPSAAAAAAADVGFPVALKVLSADVVHKTEAGAVVTGLGTAADVEAACATVLSSARERVPGARLDGVLVQAMAGPGLEVIVGATRDPTFGSLVAFGRGGTEVELSRDVTFALAPIPAAEALLMLDRVGFAPWLRGSRGRPAVDTKALAELIVAVSHLIDENPEISEVDLNPVLVDQSGVMAVDVRVLLGEALPRAQSPWTQEQILRSMEKLLRPASIAVIGASAEAGKIGNSVLRNLVQGGYQGKIHPVNPKGGEILGLPCKRSVAEIDEEVDVAIFAIPAAAVPAGLEEIGRQGIPTAVLIPSGFAETGRADLQEQVQEVARRYGIRFLGPNIYGYYYTPDRVCATFCTPYDVRGPVALSSQSGGIGMAILGFARSANLGVSAIVGLGNKADVDEDDLLTFFEQDQATSCIAMHMEDLKDGRAFLDAARRVSPRKPVIVLKAGRTRAGARAARSHTGALAGDDRVYEDLLAQHGVVRAPGLREMLEYARALPAMPTPRGENVLIITGAGGSGVLLSDACVAEGLRLMTVPQDLDASFRKLIPPFGASGNPIDITGGEPPSTYRAAIDLGLRDPRVHALVIGYWHTIVTPPHVFAELAMEVVEAARRDGHSKPVVVSLAGDVEVEEAADLLFRHQIPAYPYTTETPVAVLGAKYRWARANHLIEG
ncbi:MAG: acetate--CoA ligase family protein [Candidatus Dormibacteria bacterium]